MSRTTSRAKQLDTLDHKKKNTKTSNGIQDSIMLKSNPTHDLDN